MTELVMRMDETLGEYAARIQADAISARLEYVTAEYDRVGARNAELREQLQAIRAALKPAQAEAPHV